MEDDAFWEQCMLAADRIENATTASASVASHPPAQLQPAPPFPAPPPRAPTSFTAPGRPLSAAPAGASNSFRAPVIAAPRALAAAPTVIAPLPPPPLAVLRRDCPLLAASSSSSSNSSASVLSSSTLPATLATAASTQSASIPLPTPSLPIVTTAHWKCSKCTFDNSLSQPVCDACDSLPPVQAPAGATTSLPQPSNGMVSSAAAPFRVMPPSVKPQAAPAPGAAQFSVSVSALPSSSSIPTGKASATTTSTPFTSSSTASVSAPAKHATSSTAPVSSVPARLPGVGTSASAIASAQKAASAELRETGPVCSGHAAPCVSMTVRKEGANKGKLFWTCPLKEDVRCKFFAWDADWRKAGAGAGGNSNSNSNGAGGSAGTPMGGRSVTVSLQWLSPEQFALEHFPLDQTLTAVLRALPGAECDPADARQWRVPFAAHATLKQSLSKIPGIAVTLIDVPPHLVKLLSPAPEHASKRSKLDGNASSGAHSSSSSSSFSAMHLTELAEFDESMIAPKLWNTLMPFQRSGVKFVAEHHGRAMIGDDMGLGKTVQAIALCAYFCDDWPILVVCPSSLRFNWSSEFLKWMPLVDESDINVIVSTKGHCDGRINIVSYDLVSKLQKRIEDAGCNIVICDESHYLKSETALRTKHVLPLLERSRRAVLLTGTPCLSRPIELFTQLHALQPQLFIHKQSFGVRYCAGVQGRFGWEFAGASHLPELHALMTRYVMIRRLKADVLHDLPAKRRQTVVFKIQDAELRASMRALDEFEAAKRAAAIEAAAADGGGDGSDRPDSERSQTGASPALLKAFATSGVAKVPAVREYLADLVQSVAKFIVFAHHQKVLDALEAAFVADSVRFIRIDGKTPPARRHQLVESFQTDESVQVALLSITAASQGLTLTAAHTVVFAEMFWTPALLLQAEDRVNRIGQRCACHIIYLLGEDTVDDLLWPMVSRKLEVLSAVMDGSARALEHDSERRQRPSDAPPIAASILLSASSSSSSPSSPATHHEQVADRAAATSAVSTSSSSSPSPSSSASLSGAAPKPPPKANAPPPAAQRSMMAAFFGKGPISID